MYKTSIDQAPMFEFDLPGAEGVGFGLLISVKDGAPNFVMERHVIAPGGHGAPHAHDWEQQMYVTAGHGVLVLDGDEYPLRPIRANFGAFGALEGPAEGARSRSRATETGPRMLFTIVPSTPGGVVLADQSPSTRKQPRVSLGWPLQRHLHSLSGAYVSAYAPPPRRRGPHRAGRAAQLHKRRS